MALFENQLTAAPAENREASVGSAICELPAGEFRDGASVFDRARHAVSFASRSLVEVCGTVRNGRAGDRLGLGAAVMRIRAKQFLRKLSPRWEFHRERVFGWMFDCFDYYEMLTTFEIVFLSREYHFKPETLRPRIVDCGSNIGLSVLFFKREFPDSQILAFEPDPVTFSLLRRNVERNGLQGIELRNLALSGSPGTRDLHCDSRRPGRTAMSLLAQCGLEERVAVPCVALSHFIHGDVDLLKLDIEGAELEVIEDLVLSGKIARIRQMVVEYHPAFFPGRDGYSWLRETLAKHGFVVELRSGARPAPGNAAAPPVTLFASRQDAGDL